MRCYFVFTIILTCIFLSSCEQEVSTEKKINNFKEYYELASINSEDKWAFMNDTVKWYFKENKDNPTYLYKGKKKTGPWAEWDKAMNPKYSYDTIWFNNNENAIEGFFFENNDFYDLIGKGPTKTHQTFWLDENDKIKEIMVYWIPEENTHTSEYLEPVQKWALEKDSTLIEEIYPDGNIAPSKQNAVKWKKLLIDYRNAHNENN